MYIFIDIAPLERREKFINSRALLPHFIFVKPKLREAMQRHLAVDLRADLFGVTIQERYRLFDVSDGAHIDIGIREVSAHLHIHDADGLRDIRRYLRSK